MQQKSNSIPRPEHPNPQWERETWENLNGEWEFEIDHGNSGLQRGILDKAHLEGKIVVPFCPESALSGIGNKDFMAAVWYRRTVTLHKKPGERILLHIGACDWECQVFCNGQDVGHHRGGYTPVTADLTDAATDGENVLFIRAVDDTRDWTKGSGKQSIPYGSEGCFYTRTTGIWQTVWLETVPETRLLSARLTPDTDNACLHVRALTAGAGTLVAEAYYEGRLMGRGAAVSCGGAAELTVPLSETHLWEVGKGRLYDLHLFYGQDRVKSYFGLRSVRMENGRFLLNGKSVFQRLILDQGFFPDGIYTAPTEEELVADIHRSMACGFNGARMHEKVFEPRYLYHADRLGYLLWGEWPNWGLDTSNLAGLPDMLEEWAQEVERDYSHPAVIGWCPFNETWDFGGRKQEDSFLRVVYRMTKHLDPTRPCIDTSGNYHVVTDIFDVHDYDQNPVSFRQRYAEAPDAAEANRRYGEARPEMKHRQTYRGEPYFVSEYGGIGWDVSKVGGWGYGNGPQSEEEFYARYEGLTGALLDAPYLMGFCYTQLTDVEQEINGLYTYDRKPKFDCARLHAITSRKAAIED